MKRICLGTMITLIYQSRIRTADTIKTICDGIFAAYGLAVEDYNKEMPSHLKSGHDPAPGGLIDAARDLTMDQIDKGFEMYVLPLIHNDKHEALFRAIKDILRDDTTILGTTLVGRTAGFEKDSILNSDTFDESALLANVVTYAITSTENDKLSANIRELGKGYVDGFVGSNEEIHFLTTVVDQDQYSPLKRTLKDPMFDRIFKKANRLSELERYNYYFQFTLTAYDKDVEPNIPSKNNIIIPAFQQLSKSLGREKVIWRYDPIFFNDRYTMEYHCKYFKVLAAKLGDYTEKCTVSFLDFYRNTARNTQPLKIHPESKEQQIELMQRFSEIAKEYGFYIDTCSEAIELDRFGITHAHCIDRERFERIGKCKLAVGKDQNQRPECGCIASIDIGTYNTCKNGCLYCYANYSHNTVMRNTQVHNPLSPLLFGEVGPDDVIKERKMVSLKECQLTLFDSME